MMVQRARNVLAYGTVPIIIYIDAIDLVRKVTIYCLPFFVLNVEKMIFLVISVLSVLLYLKVSVYNFTA